MGYPMTYRRMLHRNQLGGGYDAVEGDFVKNAIRGDLRRFEQDSMDRNLLPEYCAYAGITLEQGKRFLEGLFNDELVPSQGPYKGWPDDPPSVYGPQWGNEYSPETPRWGELKKKKEQ